MAMRITVMGIIMTDASLIRLMAWLSPVFPTGSFAYSAGLEQAVAQGSVDAADGLSRWLETLLRHGSPWNDAVLFAAAWRGAASEEAIRPLSELCAALAGSAERHREILDQGSSFTAAARHWFADAPLPAGLPLPVAVGCACGRAGIALKAALGAYLASFLSNQLQCAIRLSVTGQDGAARLLAQFEPVIGDVAARAATSTLDDLGSAAFRAEIAAMNHETLQPRLFLS
ncbi:MAG: urease accessory protein UreF [Nitratireductor sp.]|nr:urease accessory protein UreF [Nitratireductor sp.]